MVHDRPRDRVSCGMTYEARATRYRGQLETVDGSIVDMPPGSTEIWKPVGFRWLKDGVWHWITRKQIGHNIKEREEARRRELEKNPHLFDKSDLARGELLDASIVMQPPDTQFQCIAGRGVFAWPDGRFISCRQVHLNLMRVTF